MSIEGDMPVNKIVNDSRHILLGRIRIARWQFFDSIYGLNKVTKKGRARRAEIVIESAKELKARGLIYNPESQMWEDSNDGTTWFP